MQSWVQIPAAAPNRNLHSNGPSFEMPKIRKMRKYYESLRKYHFIYKENFSGRKEGECADL
ncbi:hypothetical protein DRO22_02860 [Candidatus Bathyarchaeota archaeon]|nr:MAG: hypothetical protein DRO22_02860 [Candidatus Bathyarchaeota archaeon]